MSTSTPARDAGFVPLGATRAWSLGTVRRLVAETISRHEHAWFLVPALRRALLAEAALDVVRAAERETISIAAVDTLLEDLLRVAGVEP